MNENLLKLATYVENRQREIGQSTLAGAPSLAAIATALRSLADPRTETELARRSGAWPYHEGRALTAATQRWSSRPVGHRSMEAAVAMISALYLDGHAAHPPEPEPVEDRDTAIRREKREGASVRQLAKRYGLSVGRISQITNAAD